MNQSNLKLSILVASIPSRFAMAQSLYERLLEAAKDLPVEVLMLTDNKRRSIGKKREGLLKLANGKYVMWIDDDEDFFADYVNEVVAATDQNPDVITFKQLCTLDGKSFVVDFDLTHKKNEAAQKDEEGNYQNINRRPFHVCAWRADIAKQHDFADVGYGEDWDWCKRVLKKVKTQAKIDKILHHYIYNSQVTEAPTESNEVWQNPKDKIAAEPKQYKRCIVNFADTKGWYGRGQQRLVDACKTHFKGDVIAINNYEQIGSPSHHDNPYAFKVYAIEHARQLGYNSILYVDSSIFPVKDLDPVFDFIEKTGHLMQHAGHYVDSWCNDACRQYFELSKEESEGMLMYSAGFTGLNFTDPSATAFFEAWKKAAEDGAFKGEWTNHRHDMTCASIIANRMGLAFESFRWLTYIGPGYGTEVPQESYFHCVPA